MQERVSYGKAYPEAMKAMLALSQTVEKTGLAPQLIDLINYRVSQLNGCAFCLDMHSKDARARGETEQRLYMISAWREAPHLYNGRERTALGWAEAVTRLEHQKVPDAVYDVARQEFTDAELSQLTLAVVAINCWNRFNVAFHTPAGSYKSAVMRKTARRFGEDGTRLTRSIFFGFKQLGVAIRMVERERGGSAPAFLPRIVFTTVQGPWCVSLDRSAGGCYLVSDSRCFAGERNQSTAATTSNAGTSPMR
jgi:AhpD family alkylhydroperoxidase